MFVVALTGGIGCGKSAAATIFADLGVKVTDVDVISHALTAANQPIINEIKQIFGSDYISADNSLNRTAMRTLIFNDDKARLKLNALLHPKILNKAILQLNQTDYICANSKPPQLTYQVLVVPLLFSSPAYLALVDKILVIDCDRNTQINRVKERSQLSEHEIIKIIETQTTRENQLEMADDIVVNNENIEKLRENIISLHQKYIKTCILSKTIS